MERVQCLAARAMAYSATAVLPALVCAATNTLSPCKPRSGDVSSSAQGKLLPLTVPRTRLVLHRQRRLKSVSLATQYAM